MQRFLVCASRLSRLDICSVSCPPLQNNHQRTKQARDRFDVAKMKIYSSSVGSLDDAKSFDSGAKPRRKRPLARSAAAGDASVSSSLPDTSRRSVVAPS